MRNLVVEFYINWSLAFFKFVCRLVIFRWFSCFLSKPLATCKSQVAAARKMRLPGASPKYIPTLQIHLYPSSYTYKYTYTHLSTQKNTPEISYTYLHLEKVDPQTVHFAAKTS